MKQPSDLFDRSLRPIGAALTLCLAILCILLSMWSSGTLGQDTSFMERLLSVAVTAENWFYDARSNNSYVHEQKSPNIVILAIDEQSLATIGRWPWSRTNIAKILDNLREYGAKTVAFDIIFSEPEKGGADTVFADSIKRFQSIPGNEAIVSYGLTSDPKEAYAPDELFFRNQVSGKLGNEENSHASTLSFVTPELRKASPGLGFIEAQADPDGIFRHTRVVERLDDMLMPSLGFALFRNQFKAVKENQIDVNFSKKYLRISYGKDEKLLRLNEDGQLKLRFYGEEEAFTLVPIHEVFQDTNPAHSKLKNIFAGKAVLIGSTAFGAYDLRHTPVSAKMPGLYIHANLFHMFDQGYFFAPDTKSIGWTLFLLAIGASFILFAARFRNPLLETTVMLVVALGVYAIDKKYFIPQGYFIRLFSCEFAFVGIYSWFTVLNLFKENKEKKKIRATFTRYVAPEIVKEMLANPEKLHVGGEKKELTMLFSDVRDFASISESLSPQDLSTLLNIYMGKMTDILFDTQGTLDKYIGDALVGFWGAPVAIPNQAYQAVCGAKKMLEALPAINEEFQKRNFPKIAIGIGLNTGEVSVGNMGSDRIFAYTALGDHMNLASRLENLTKQYGVHLLLSEYTYEKLGSKRSEFQIRPIDNVQVKGKTKPVKIYEVLASWHPFAKDSASLDDYKKAYTLYLDRDFASAKKLWETILSKHGDDKASKFLWQAADNYTKTAPPADWNGITVFTTK